MKIADADFAVAYLDDVFRKSMSGGQHVERGKMVFEKINAYESEQSEGIGERLRPIPKNLATLQGFLGFLNHHQSNIKKHA